MHRISGEIRDFSSLVLTAQILCQRTGKAVKWDLPTARETFFFSFGKQPDRTFSDIERAQQQEEITSTYHLMSNVRQPRVDTL